MTGEAVVIMTPEQAKAVCGVTKGCTGNVIIEQAGEDIDLIFSKDATLVRRLVLADGSVLEAA